MVGGCQYRRLLRLRQIPETGVEQLHNACGKRSAARPGFGCGFARHIEDGARQQNRQRKKQRKEPPRMKNFHFLHRGAYSSS